MKKLKEFWRSLDGLAVVRKRELLLVGLNLFLWGINLGILLSPRKNVSIGCNNNSAVPAKEAEKSEEE